MTTLYIRSGGNVGIMNGIIQSATLEISRPLCETFGKPPKKPERKCCKGKYCGCHNRGDTD